MPPMDHQSTRIGEKSLKPFQLVRTKDETGVSGTGHVADGVVFDNGWVALMWLSDRPSLAFYSTIEDVLAIHGHQGSTSVVFLSDRDGITD